MGKLIFPKIYLEIGLLKAIAANYEPTARVVRTQSRKDIFLGYQGIICIGSQVKNKE